MFGRWAFIIKLLWCGKCLFAMQWVYCLKTTLLVCFNFLIVYPQIRIRSIFSVSVIWIWFEKIGVNHPPYHGGDKTAKIWNADRTCWTTTKNPFTAAFGCHVGVWARLRVLPSNAKSCEQPGHTGCSIATRAASSIHRTNASILHFMA